MKEEKKTEAWEETFEDIWWGSFDSYGERNSHEYEKMLSYIKTEKEASYKEGYEATCHDCDYGMGSEEKRKKEESSMMETAYLLGKKEGVNEVLVEVEKMIKKVDEDGVDPFDYVAGAEISAYKKVLSILNKYKI